MPYGPGPDRQERDTPGKRELEQRKLVPERGRSVSALSRRLSVLLVLSAPHRLPSVLSVLSAPYEPSSVHDGKMVEGTMAGGTLAEGTPVADRRAAPERTIHRSLRALTPSPPNPVHGRPRRTKQAPRQTVTTEKSLPYVKTQTIIHSRLYLERRHRVSRK